MSSGLNGPLGSSERKERKGEGRLEGGAGAAGAAEASCKGRAATDADVASAWSMLQREPVDARECWEASDGRDEVDAALLSGEASAAWRSMVVGAAESMAACYRRWCFEFLGAPGGTDAHERRSEKDAKGGRPARSPGVVT